MSDVSARVARALPTAAQIELIDAIQRVWLETKQPPSFRELATLLGWTIGTTSNRLRELQRRGLVTWEPEQYRTIKLVPSSGSLPFCGEVR